MTQKKLFFEFRVSFFRSLVSRSNCSLHEFVEMADSGSTHKTDNHIGKFMKEAVVLTVEADFQIRGLVMIYENVVVKILNSINGVQGPYWLKPVIVMENVIEDGKKCLERIHSQVNGYFVRSVVRNGQLLILDVSAAFNLHAAARQSICVQASNWKTVNQNAFIVLPDVASNFGPELTGGPDVSIRSGSKYRLARSGGNVVGESKYFILKLNCCCLSMFSFQWPWTSKSATDRLYKCAKTFCRISRTSPCCLWWLLKYLPLHRMVRCAALTL